MTFSEKDSDFQAQSEHNFLEWIISENLPRGFEIPILGPGKLESMLHEAFTHHIQHSKALIILDTYFYDKFKVTSSTTRESYLHFDRWPNTVAKMISTITDIRKIPPLVVDDSNEDIKKWMFDPTQNNDVVANFHHCRGFEWSSVLYIMPDPQKTTHRP